MNKIIDPKNVEFHGHEKDVITKFQTDSFTAVKNEFHNSFMAGKNELHNDSFMAMKMSFIIVSRLGKTSYIMIVSWL